MTCIICNKPVLRSRVYNKNALYHKKCYTAKKRNFLYDEIVRLGIALAKIDKDLPRYLVVINTKIFELFRELHSKEDIEKICIVDSPLPATSKRNL